MRITRRAALISTAAFAIHRRAGAAETVKIGQLAPSTGSGAEYGRFEMNGMKLALTEINDAGGVLGRQLEVITEDDQTTAPCWPSAGSRRGTTSWPSSARRPRPRTTRSPRT